MDGFVHDFGGKWTNPSIRCKETASHAAAQPLAGRGKRKRGYEDAALLAESLLYVRRLGRSFMRTSETRKLKPA
ncbi:hypothetical protein GCM10027093_34680 [Paraburkholderia jirisanensis]